MTTLPLASGNLLIGVGTVVVAADVVKFALEVIMNHCGFTSPVPPVSDSLARPLFGILLGGFLPALFGFLLSRG